MIPMDSAVDDKLALWKIREYSAEDQKPARKTILITGATSGIGKTTAAQLASLGHQVVIVGRNKEKCRAAAETILNQTGRMVHWLAADLSSQAQVRGLAEEFMRRYSRLDVLINNAGAVYFKRSESVEGHEMCWSVNYLQSFLLTRLLLDLLKRSAPAKIINLSSSFHRTARLNLKNIQEKGLYLGWNVYARCKLASLYFTYELANRLEGSGVTVNAIHPGLVKTGIGKNGGWLLRSAVGLVDWFAITPEKAAEALVNLAVNPYTEMISGLYFNGMDNVPSSSASYDENIGRRLWQLSEAMTGLSDLSMN